MVDGLGVGDVGNIVYARPSACWPRTVLLIVVLTLEKHSNQLLAVTGHCVPRFCVCERI